MKFVINYSCGKTIKTMCFSSVAEGYQWAIENLAKRGDYRWYKKCCGESLDNVKGDKLQAAVLRNSFTKVRSVELIEN